MAGANERSVRSVFVGNIPYEASEERLKDIFSEAGPVISFKLVYDRESGKPKGFGFCEYRDQETALSAMRNLNGYELNGRALRVDTATNERFREEIKNLHINAPSGGGGIGGVGGGGPGPGIPGPGPAPGIGGGGGGLPLPSGATNGTTGGNPLGVGVGMGVNVGTNGPHGHFAPHLHAPHPSHFEPPSPYGAEVDPDKAPETISKVVASLHPEQAWELAKQMKHLVLTNPSEARNLLLKNPQLAYAMLQSLVAMRAVDVATASAILYKPAQSPIPLQATPGASVVPPPMMPPGVVGPPPGVGAPPTGPPMMGPPPGVVGPPPGMFVPVMPPVVSMVDDPFRSGPPPPQLPPSGGPPPPGVPVSVVGGGVIPGPGSLDPRLGPAPTPLDPRLGGGGGGGAGGSAPQPPPLDPRLRAAQQITTQTGPSSMSSQMIPQPSSQSSSSITSLSSSSSSTIGGQRVGPPGRLPLSTGGGGGGPPITTIGGNGHSQQQPSSQSSTIQQQQQQQSAAEITEQSEQEKAQLIMQVLALSDHQIAQLPDEQRQSILVLKEQLARGGQP